MSSVQALVGVFASLVRPEAPGEGVDSGAYKAYLGAFNACRQDREACLEMFRGAGVAAVSGGLEAAAGVAGVSAGFAETVVSSAPGVAAATKELFVDGVAFASVAAEAASGCASDPVACVTRGRNYLRNKAKRERRKAAGKEKSPVVDDAALRQSFSARRIAENELAVARAKFQLQICEDPGVKAAKSETERRRVLGQAAAAALKSQRSFDDLSSVSPGSSVSQSEYRSVQAALESAQVRMDAFERLAYEYCPVEKVTEVRRLHKLSAVASDFEEPVTMAEKIAEFKKSFPDIYPEDQDEFYYG